MDKKNPKFLEYFNQFKRFNKNINFKDALKYIKKAIPYNDNFEYWILSCEIYLSLKMFSDADNAISNAIHINNKSAKAWYLKAKVLMGLRDCKKALRASNRALSIESKPEYISLNQYIQKFLHSSNENNQTSYNTTYSFNFNYMNNEDNIVKLVNRKSIELVARKKINPSVYNAILNKIIDDALYKINIPQKDIYSKIVTFVNNLVDLNYKDEGESHGTYIFNRVEIDNRLIISHKIAALIHEIAHHLLSEIFEQALMYIFDSIKTDTIEALAWYAISQKPDWLLMNEYCAHTVECYYMPYEGHNYESFNKVLNENFNISDPEDIKRIKIAAKVGNTFAQDIIYMLNKFFSEDLKNEIKIQYVKDRLFFTYHYGTEFLTTETFNEQYKLDLINSILKDALIDVKLNFSYGQLYQFKQSFCGVNMNYNSIQVGP